MKYITQEQIEDIEHIKRMFNLNAERIEKLCSVERGDIQYGFELGQIYSHLKEMFISTDNLLEELSGQVIEKHEED